MTTPEELRAKAEALRTLAESGVAHEVSRANQLRPLGMATAVPVDSHLLLALLDERDALLAECSDGGLSRRHELDEELQQVDDAVEAAGHVREQGAVACIQALAAEVAAVRGAGRWIPCADAPAHSRTVAIKYGKGSQIATGFHTPSDGGQWLRFKSAGLCGPLPGDIADAWYFELPAPPEPAK